MEKLHPKAIWKFFLGFVKGLPIILFAFWIIQFRILTAPDQEAITVRFLQISLGITVFLIIFSYIWAVLTYNNYRYRLDEKNFRSEKGVIFKRYLSIPYGRIQNLEIRRGIIDRILGLSTLYIETAGKGIEGEIPGLSRESTERLREELIKKVEILKGQGL